jgi:RNA polymerase sigma factor (sigma-70 family)
MVKFPKFGKRSNLSKTDVYNKYGRKLYGYAITKWKVTEDEAWDLVYKTIDKTIETYDKYNFGSEDKFASFIFKIFINFLRNHYRDTKNKRLEMVSFEEGVEYTKQDNDYLNEEEPESLNMKLLKEELSKLEDWQRVLLLMRAQNYSYEEISEIIKKPAEQMKVYYLRYKQKILKNINDKLVLQQSDRKEY